MDDWVRLRSYAWFVRSDISNFFPSINLQLLRHCVAQRTDADEDLTNLLFMMLESMTPRPSYSQNRYVGLPVEDYDASRVLAHAYLHTVDRTFQAEIEQHRYARWVDDFIVAVSDEHEGRRVLQRLEKALENRGLFPNSAKSGVVPLARLYQEMYPEWNDFLDQVHKSTQRPSRGKAVTVAEFDEKLQAFLSIAEGQRFENWERVLRRFYTQARRIGSALLEDHALCHLRSLPTCSDHVLRYLLGRPFSPRLLAGILEYLTSLDNIYQDVEIRVYEFLLQWGVPPDPAQCRLIAESGASHFHAKDQFSGKPPLTEHSRGLISLLLYKFGPSHVPDVANFFLADRVADPSFARYALCVLSGSDQYRDEALARAAKLEDRTTRQIHAFVTTVYRKPELYRDVLKKRVNVQTVEPPTYRYFPARMLPVVRLARSQPAFRTEWDRHLEQVLSRLQHNEQGAANANELLDGQSISIIKQVLEQP